MTPPPAPAPLAPPRPTVTEPSPPRPGFLFSSPEATLHADRLIPATLNGQAPLCAQVWKLLQAGHAAPLLVGAVPFDPRQGPRLFVAPEVRWQSGPPVPGSPPPQARVRTVQPIPAPEHYEEMVREALAAFGAGTLEKVVFARTLVLELEEPLDVPWLARHLAAQNPAGYTFALDLSPSGPPHVLVGASPELLVQKRGRTVRLQPMAGTRPRLADPQEDGRYAAALLDSAKDLHEHAVVVQAIRETLEPLCTRLELPDRPRLVGTPNLWHLATPIRGELRDPDLTVLDLVTRLHPTPAVCGQPQDAARAFIERAEPFSRGLFTGAVGWCDAHGDGEWAVTIRCAEVQGQGVRLFAGAGIVPDSVPGHERAETGAKFMTLLRALGLEMEGTAL